MTLLITLLFQLTTAPYLQFGFVQPNFLLMVTVSWVILRGLDEGLLIALFAGLAFDFTSPTPFGLFTLTMLSIVPIIYFIHNRVFGGSSFALAPILILPASLLFNLIALSLLMMTTDRIVSWTSTLAVVVLPISIVNTIVMVPIFTLLYLLDWALDRPQRATL